MRWRAVFCGRENDAVDGCVMKVDGKHIRSIWLEPDGWSVGAIDQRRLPHEFIVARLTTLEAAADAIRTMLVRGAPLIGATAAYGMALAMRADASDAAIDAGLQDADRNTADRDQPALGARRDAHPAAAVAAGRARRRGLCARRRHRRRRRRHQPGHRPPRPCSDRGDCRDQETGRARQRADPLQRRLAGDGRLGHGARADLPGA